jgi:hypothetical protein
MMTVDYRDVGSGMSGLNLNRARITLSQPSPTLETRLAEDGVTAYDSW